MKHIKQLIKDLLASFNNDPGGMSARKLSAFMAVVVCTSITFMFTNTENISTVLTIWLIYALLCKGIITAEQVIRFREGGTSQTTVAEKKEVTVTTKDIPAHEKPEGE